MQQAQILAKCKEVFAKATELYKVDLSKTAIRFDLKGRCAGTAQMRGSRLAPQLIMRFNADMLTREAFDHILNDTVPHESAHLVCFLNPMLGRNHDYGWSRVCKALGGSGARCHKEEVVYGKGNTYEYTTTVGKQVRLSDHHHKRVQRGETLRYRNGMGSVTKMCTYSIVGVQGRTLVKPVVKAPNHPAVIEEAVRTALPAGKLVGTDQYPAAFGKEALVAKPVKPAPAPYIAPPVAGESKAATSRRIMLAGHKAGKTYEEIIDAMIAACGYERQLARATYKANAAKVGIPL
jgi:predicted SprT family Zn-dependent metalloprotease